MEVANAHLSLSLRLVDAELERGEQVAADVRVALGMDLVLQSRNTAQYSTKGTSAAVDLDGKMG